MRLKAIDGFPKYFVTDDGRVYSEKRGHYLKLNKTKYGYPILNLSNGSKDKVRMVYAHHLVAQAFLGQKPNGYEIVHLDGNPQNNTVGNLSYETHKTNMLHRRIHGTCPNGSKHPNHKLTEKIVEEIKTRLDITQTAFAKKYNVDQSLISRIRSGQYWWHVKVI